MSRIRCPKCKEMIGYTPNDDGKRVIVECKYCGHELKGPEGFENTYGVWCACGFRGPVFYLDPKDLKLELKDLPPNTTDKAKGEKGGTIAAYLNAFLNGATNASLKACHGD